jgi:hypothetical protein
MFLLPEEDFLPVPDELTERLREPERDDLPSDAENLPAIELLRLFELLEERPFVDREPEPEFLFEEVRLPDLPLEELRD